MAMSLERWDDSAGNDDQPSVKPLVVLEPPEITRIISLYVEIVANITLSHGYKRRV